MFKPICPNQGRADEANIPAKRGGQQVGFLVGHQPTGGANRFDDFIPKWGVEMRQVVFSGRQRRGWPEQRMRGNALAGIFLF